MDPSNQGYFIVFQETCIVTIYDSVNNRNLSKWLPWKLLDGIWVATVSALKTCLWADNRPSARVTIDHLNKIILAEQIQAVWLVQCPWSDWRGYFQNWSRDTYTQYCSFSLLSYGEVRVQHIIVILWYYILWGSFMPTYLHVKLSSSPWYSRPTLYYHVCDFLFT